jgi:hypothetical protein
MKLPCVEHCAIAFERSVGEEEKDPNVVTVCNNVKHAGLTGGRRSCLAKSVLADRRSHILATRLHSMTAAMRDRVIARSTTRWCSTLYFVDASCCSPSGSTACASIDLRWQPLPCHVVLSDL